MWNFIQSWKNIYSAFTESNDTAGRVSKILNVLINYFFKGHFLTETKKIILSCFTEIELFQNYKTKIYHLLLFCKTGKNVTFQLWAYFFHHIIRLHSADNQDVYSAINIKPAYVEGFGSCFDPNSSEISENETGNKMEPLMPLL